MSIESPEFSGGAPEKSKDDDKDKKKKTGSSAVRFGALAPEAPSGLAGTAETKPAEQRPEPKGFDALLKQIRGETTKPKEKDLPFFVLPKPEVAVDKPTVVEPTKRQKSAEEAPEKLSAENVEEEAGAPADVETVAERELTEAEKAELKQAAQDFIELKLDDTGGELQEIPLEDADTAKAAETAAAFAYYREMEQSFDGDPSVDAEQAAEQAAEAVAEQMERDHDESPESEAPAAAEQPGAEHQESEDDEDAEDDPAAAAGAGAGGAGTPPPPPGPPGPGTAANQPPDPFGPNNPLFNQPPGPVRTPSSPNYAPSSGTAPSYDAYRAGAQGLLIGGVAGYFIGRHLGRKQGARAAEKKASPIRKSLEQQVKNLQESITRKEFQVKSLAREKMEAIQGRKDREKFVHNMLNSAPSEAPSVVAAATAATLAERPAVKPEQPRTPSEVLNVPAERSSLGRMLGEVPLAAAAIAAAPVVAERAAQQRDAAKKPPEVIPFNKDVKEFTRQELMATAEKVKIEGRPLKEMAELGELDEPGLRRVVAEFLRGGDVTKTFNQEVKAKELPYEQDPHLRHHKDGQGGISPQAAGAGGLIVSGLLGGAPPADGSHTLEPGDAKPYEGSKPQPDEATLRAIRNRQAATVAGTVLFIIVAVIIAIALT